MNLPDQRGWTAIGLFVLVGLGVALMALNPELAKTDLFKTVFTSLVTGGVLLVASYYFGSSHGPNGGDPQ